jgi:hypothetical protein
MLIYVAEVVLGKGIGCWWKGSCGGVEHPRLNLAVDE